MAQLSRPYQIVLGAVVVLGLVWALALHAHGSNPSAAPSSHPSSAPTTSSPSTSSPSSAAAQAKAAAAPTPIYHGAAPGVEGLTRAIAKAHGAVATSQRNAQQLQSKSSEASDESQAATATTTHPNVATAKASAGAAATQQSILAATLARKAAARARNSHSPSKAHGSSTSQQVAVESELAHGKTVMLIFWNPKSTVDQEVRAQAAALAGRSKGAVTLHVALANQVGTFGTITEVAQVYQTPTILIVNHHGVVSTLTGLTDVFALEQAVREARSAVG